MDGLLRDKTRSCAGKPPLPAADRGPGAGAHLRRAARVHEVTHWTGRAMAKAVGISLRAVQRIWEAPAPAAAPHSAASSAPTYPAFAAKVTDIVGLYMHPPAHDRGPAVDRTRSRKISNKRSTAPSPVCRCKIAGKCGTMTHRLQACNGTTTACGAALRTVVEGTVLGRCMQKHTHREFIRFLNAVERAVPAGKMIHAIADNYATHKRIPRCVACAGPAPALGVPLSRRPRRSWINAVGELLLAH